MYLITMCPQCFGTTLDPVPGDNTQMICKTCHCYIELRDMRIGRPNEEGCYFCNNFDFGEAGIVHKYGRPHVALKSGIDGFPESDQFRFCPECGNPVRSTGGALHVRWKRYLRRLRHSR